MTPRYRQWSNSPGFARVRVLGDSVGMMLVPRSVRLVAETAPPGQGRKDYAVLNLKLKSACRICMAPHFLHGKPARLLQDFTRDQGMDGDLAPPQAYQPSFGEMTMSAMCFGTGSFFDGTGNQRICKYPPSKQFQECAMILRALGKSAN